MENYVKILVQLMGIVDMQEHEKLRVLHYALAMRTAQLNRYILDIALTVDLHPALLGLETEEQGRFFVGGGLSFRVRYCQNLFRSGMEAKHMRTEEGYLTKEAIMNRRICQVATYPANEQHIIPQRVMMIQTDRCAVAAVIVVEHRNVAEALQYWRDDLADCLVVMVIIPPIYLISLTNRDPTRPGAIRLAPRENFLTCLPNLFRWQNSFTIPIMICRVSTSSRC